MFFVQKGLSPDCGGNWNENRHQCHEDDQDDQQLHEGGGSAGLGTIGRWDAHGVDRSVLGGGVISEKIICTLAARSGSFWSRVLTASRSWFKRGSEATVSRPPG